MILKSLKFNYPNLLKTLNLGFQRFEFKQITGFGISSFFIKIEEPICRARCTSFLHTKKGCEGEHKLIQKYCYPGKMDTIIFNLVLIQTSKFLLSIPFSGSQLM